MSEYLNVYARVKDNHVCLGSYSRNSYFYRAFDAPYGKLEQLTEERLLAARNWLKEKICYYIRGKEELNNKLSFLQGMAYSQELMTEYDSVIVDLAGLRAELDELNECDNRVTFMLDILDDWENEEVGVSLWYGIEASPNDDDDDDND